MEQKKDYQLIIVGGGPAGLTAGIYAARGKLDVLLIERAIWGGQANYAEKIENFPGFPQGLSGMELSELMHKQALQWGLKTLVAEVTGIALEGEHKIVSTSEGDFRALAVILASGAERSKLAVPGEQELLGRGVSYCATCDGAFFVDEVVAVIGGGDTAINEALALTHHARRVILIHRRDQLRATRVLQERLATESKIQVLLDTVVEAIEGEERVNRLKLRNVKTGSISHLDVGGVFVAVGTRPNSAFIKDLLELDKQGQIVANDTLETKSPGIFAAGDIRHSSFKQCITAAGDGAAAAMAAERYLTERRK